MATRTYCDHCGKTISGSAEIFCFGPKSYINVSSQSYQQAGANGGPLSYSLQPTTTMVSTNPKIVVEQVDLCLVCVPIWMTRVKKLTQASDA
jgi:hypothetical protein